jgi:hypothetical protein
MNLISIVRLAARRKGIARSAALHLDCARSARKTDTYRFTLITSFDIDQSTLSFAMTGRIAVPRKKRTAFDKVGGANRGCASNVAS